MTLLAKSEELVSIIDNEAFGNEDWKLIVKKAPSDIINFIAQVQMFWQKALSVIFCLIFFRHCFIRINKTFNRKVVHK